MIIITHPALEAAYARADANVGREASFRLHTDPLGTKPGRTLKRGAQRAASLFCFPAASIRCSAQYEKGGGCYGRVQR